MQSSSRLESYGFGAVVDTEGVTADRIKRLIHLAPVYEAWVQKTFEDQDISEPTVKDYEELDEDNIYGLAGVLAEVIAEAEGIRLTPCEEADGCKYILYRPTYPWKMTEQERGLSEGGIAVKIKKYIRLLTGRKVRVCDYKAQTIINFLYD